MTIDPRRLLVLRAVHDAGGVHAAARRLHLTPSAVSQHLGRLERETGLVLLDRSRWGGGRTVTLSSAGRALAVQADALAEFLTEIGWTVEMLRGAPAEAVVVGAFPSALERLVAPAVTALAHSHPAIRVRVMEISDSAAHCALAAGTLDVAILEYEGDAAPRHVAGVTERALLRDPFRLLVPSDWSTSMDDEAVLASPWIIGPAGSTALAAFERLATAAGGGGPRSAHECLEFPATVALVGAGLGAALVPDLALFQAPHPGIRVHRGSLDTGSRVLTVASHGGQRDTGTAVKVVVSEIRRQATDARHAPRPVGQFDR